MINDIFNLSQELLNKNGYGILSPIRFMLFAKQSQLKLLMNAIDRYKREKNRKDIGSYSDSLRVLEALIDKFRTSKMLTRFDGSLKEFHILPDDYMAFDVATVGKDIDITEIEASRSGMLLRSKILTASEKQPFGYVEGHRLYVLPETIGIINDGGLKIRYDEVFLRYIRYPKNPVWTYQLVDGKPIFNISDPNYQDFELPESMFDSLVTDILSQAGLHIRDEFISAHTRSVEASEFNKDNQ